MMEKEELNHYGQYLEFTIRNLVTFLICISKEKPSAEVCTFNLYLKKRTLWIEVSTSKIQKLVLDIKSPLQIVKAF